MDDFVDYYELLDVTPPLDTGELREALKTARRRWQKRTNHPELPQRQRAETAVEQLSNAEEVLLDPARRRAYDEQWRARRAGAGESQHTQRHTAEREAPGGGRRQTGDRGGHDRDVTERRRDRETTAGRGDRDTSAGRRRGGDPRGRQDRADSAHWIGEAQRRLADGDLAAAAYFAREATMTDPGDAHAWAIRGHISAESDALDDALVELRRALELAPDDPYTVSLYAEVLWRSERWQEALVHYEHAKRLAPDDAQHDIGAAYSLQRLGRVQDAIVRLEDAHARHPSHPEVADALAEMYHEAIVGLGTDVDGGVLITSKQGVAAATDMVERALSLDVAPELRDTLAGLEAVVRRTRSRQFALPVLAALHGFRTVAILTLVVAYVVVAVALPWISSGDMPTVARGVAVLGVLGWLGFEVVFMPGWKLNRRRVRLLTAAHDQEGTHG